MSGVVVTIFAEPTPRPAAFCERPGMRLTEERHSGGPAHLSAQVDSVFQARCTTRTVRSRNRPERWLVHIALTSERSSPACARGIGIRCHELRLLGTGRALSMMLPRYGEALDALASWGLGTLGGVEHPRPAPFRSIKWSSTELRTPPVDPVLRDQAATARRARCLAALPCLPERKG